MLLNKPSLPVGCVDAKVETRAVTRVNIHGARPTPIPNIRLDTVIARMHLSNHARGLRALAWRRFPGRDPAVATIVSSNDAASSPAPMPKVGTSKAASCSNCAVKHMASTGHAAARRHVKHV
jgi:hypothetical protein